MRTAFLALFLLIQQKPPDRILSPAEMALTLNSVSKQHGLSLTFKQDQNSVIAELSDGQYASLGKVLGTGIDIQQLLGMKLSLQAVKVQPDKKAGNGNTGRLFGGVGRVAGAAVGGNTGAAVGGAAGGSIGNSGNTQPAPSEKRVITAASPFSTADAKDYEERVDLLKLAIDGRVDEVTLKLHPAAPPAPVLTADDAALQGDIAKLNKTQIIYTVEAHAIIARLDEAQAKRLSSVFTEVKREDLFGSTKFDLKYNVNDQASVTGVTLIVNGRLTQTDIDHYNQNSAAISVAVATGAIDVVRQLLHPSASTSSVQFQQKQTPPSQSASDTANMPPPPPTFVIPEVLLPKTNRPIIALRAGYYIAFEFPTDRPPRPIDRILRVSVNGPDISVYEVPRPAQEHSVKVETRIFYGTNTSNPFRGTYGDPAKGAPDTNAPMTILSPDVFQWGDGAFVAVFHRLDDSVHFP